MKVWVQDNADSWKLLHYILRRSTSIRIWPENPGSYGKDFQSKERKVGEGGREGARDTLVIAGEAGCMRRPSSSFPHVIEWYPSVDTTSLSPPYLFSNTEIWTYAQNCTYPGVVLCGWLHTGDRGRE